MKDVEYNGKQYKYDVLKKALGLSTLKGVDIEQAIIARRAWEDENVFFNNRVVYQLKDMCNEQNVQFTGLKKLQRDLGLSAREAYDTIMIKRYGKYYTGSKFDIKYKGVVYKYMIDFYIGTNIIINFGDCKEYIDIGYKAEKIRDGMEKKIYYRGKGFRSHLDLCQYYEIPYKNDTDQWHSYVDDRLEIKSTCKLFGVNRTTIIKKNSLAKHILKQLGAHRVGNITVVMCPVCGFNVVLADGEEEQFIKHSSKFCKAHAMEVV